jgi:hypothetical protein
VTVQVRSPVIRDKKERLGTEAHSVNRGARRDEAWWAVEEEEHV